MANYDDYNPTPQQSAARQAANRAAEQALEQAARSGKAPNVYNPAVKVKRGEINNIQFTSSAVPRRKGK